jgi:uncharacterized membrane protein YczE
VRSLVPPEASRRRRVTVLLVGLACVAIGVACTIEAELGVAPYDVLSTGLRDRFGIPIALAAILLPLAFIAAGRALGGRPGVGSVLAVALVGPMLGFVLHLIPHVEPMVPRLALYAGGFLVLTVGIALVIVPGIGAGPAELLMLAIHQRGYPLAPVRTAIEIGSVAVGWALGGQVGAGTVVFALLIGPALRRVLELLGYDTRAPAEATDAASAQA